MAVPFHNCIIVYPQDWKELKNCQKFIYWASINCGNNTIMYPPRERLHTSRSELQRKFNHRSERERQQCEFSCRKRMTNTEQNIVCRRRGQTVGLRWLGTHCPLWHTKRQQTHTKLPLCSCWVWGSHTKTQTHVDTLSHPSFILYAASSSSTHCNGKSLHRHTAVTN